MQENNSACAPATMSFALLCFIFFSILILSSHSQSLSASQIYKQFEDKAACDAVPEPNCHDDAFGRLLRNITECAQKQCCQARSSLNPDHNFICCAKIKSELVVNCSTATSPPEVSVAPLDMNHNSHMFSILVSSVV